MNDNLQGMPPSWLSTLLAAGFTQEEIDSLRVVRHQRAATHPATAAATRDYVAPTMATFPVTYQNPTSLSQFGELYNPPPRMNTSPQISQSTHLHHNHNNPSKSISLFSNSVRSSSPSDSRESMSPSSHVTQQSMLSPLYTQHFAGYTSSSHSHQTYSQSDCDERTRRSHSPTETSFHAPTVSDTVTYSQQPTSMSHVHSGRRSAVTPPIHTHNYHPVMYRVVNEDPTPTTPPPAYASPKSPYRSHEKGLEKAFRWEASSNTQGQGSSGIEANASPVISQPVAELNSPHDSSLQPNSQSHRAVHVVNQSLEAEMTPSTPVYRDPPLLPSNNSDRTVSSAPGTIVGEDRHEEGDITERISLSRTSSPADDMSKSDVLEKTEVLVGHNFMENLGQHGQHPPSLTAPPRLSLHTDQDDDWSTILRFSFSGNNVNLKNDNQNTAISQSQNSPVTAPSLFTPKVNRTSRRSSVIYGPRGSPGAKEKLYHNTESTVGLEMGILHEQEECPPVTASPPVRHESMENEDSVNEDDWADNYLDMKDGDYGDLEDVDMLKGGWSQEKSISRELSLTPGRNSPRGSFDSSLTRQSLSPGTTRRSLSSPSSSQHVFVTTPKAVNPLSPSTSMISPNLSPTFAMRPTSILSRRSFDLPPPLPPPEDDLPPTPEEAAAMGLMNIPPPKLPLKSTQTMQGHITHTNTRSPRDSQRAQSPVFAPSSSRSDSQQLLSSITTNMPATTLPKRDLPPVPLKVNTGVKHAHMPMSSISSTSSHGRSASGYLSNPASLTIGRPPPLPMPPIGKVLPSVIMQQRRAAAATSDVHLSKSTTISRLSTVAANPNLTPSPSASTFSHSSRSAYSPDTSETDSISDKRGLSTTHGNSSPVRVADVSSSPASQLDEASSLTSAKGADSLECIADTKHDELNRIHGGGWSANSKSSEESNRVAGRENDVPPNIVKSLAEIVEPPSPSIPLTPSIAVNGLAVTHDSTSIRGLIPAESPQMHPIPLELPLVLHPIKEYISTNIEPLDIFFELQEIALGQYGSVYMAQTQSQGDDITATLAVAIKKVPVPTKGTPKISQLKRELALMSRIRHKHILETEALFYEHAEGMLWIQMELMERSLADILVLREEGLEVQERVIARFASDVRLICRSLFFSPANLSSRSFRRSHT